MKALSTLILELREYILPFILWIKDFLCLILVTLNFRSVLEKHLRSLTDNVDELLQDTNKFNIYQRQVVKQQQEKQKYVQKRVIFLYFFFKIYPMQIVFFCQLRI